MDATSLTRTHEQSRRSITPETLRTSQPSSTCGTITVTAADDDTGENGDTGGDNGDTGGNGGGGTAGAGVSAVAIVGGLGALAVVAFLLTQ